MRLIFHSLPSKFTTTSFFVVFVPIVAMYASLNLSTTKRRMSDDFPTAPSPRIRTFFLKYSVTPTAVPSGRGAHNGLVVIPRPDRAFGFPRVQALRHRGKAVMPRPPRRFPRTRHR